MEGCEVESGDGRNGPNGRNGLEERDLKDLRDQKRNANANRNEVHRMMIEPVNRF